MALTALKRYDNYTFTHMVNVSVLAMAQARALNLEGPLLREFGFAALMHDIGKVNTPLEVLNKPDRLTKDEFDMMKQHVVDGAHILRRTPEMPALAPVVAFEHHLRQDLSGYPENIGHRELNLCTHDRQHRRRLRRAAQQPPVPRGAARPTASARSWTQKDNPAFNTRLLRRFINLMGLFPVGTLVRLGTEEVGVVTREHPSRSVPAAGEGPARPPGRAASRPAAVVEHLGARRPRRVPVRRGRSGRSRRRAARSLELLMSQPAAPPALAPEAAARLAEFARSLQGRGARRLALPGRPSRDRRVAVTPGAGDRQDHGSRAPVTSRSATARCCSRGPRRRSRTLDRGACRGCSIVT